MSPVEPHGVGWLSSLGATLIEGSYYGITIRMHSLKSEQRASTPTKATGFLNSCIKDTRGLNDWSSALYIFCTLASSQCDIVWSQDLIWTVIPTWSTYIFLVWKKILKLVVIRKTVCSLICKLYWPCSLWELTREDATTVDHRSHINGVDVLVDGQRALNLT